MSWARLAHLFLKASGERGLCFTSMGRMGLGGLGWDGCCTGAWLLSQGLLASHLAMKWSVLA